METSELTDAQWEKLRTRHSAHDHRTVLHGIPWVLRTGGPWRSLPERDSSWKTVPSRFYERQKAGARESVLPALQLQADR